MDESSLLPDPALGVAEMDAAHEDFLRRLDALRRAADDDFPRLFEEFHRHLKLHFESESRLMRECRFPALALHEAEHRQVLGDMAVIGRSIVRRRLGLARAYVAVGLTHWYRRHIATTDAALADFLKAQAGTPA